MSSRISPTQQQNVVGFYNGKKIWYTSSEDVRAQSGKTNGHVVDIPMVGSNGYTKNGSTITAHNIRYEVTVKSRPCCGKSEKKQILKGIDGMFPPGMNAILGPTGSGKSSLLDILAGRKDPVGLSGELLIDGLPPPENFKCMVGYVVQDDVVMGTLTVRENLEFSAALRLPTSVSKAERKKRVDNVIRELGLHHCADTKVGDEFIRGVSGGERKRTNIGMELIIAPTVLFLDEPTTGLDANTANSVMLLLRRIALKGKTIVFSIHQPRFSIYRLFDNMMLLSLGDVVYHGPAEESLDHFKNIGYQIEEHNNPPDFFLDVINGDKSTMLAGDEMLKSGRSSRMSPIDQLVLRDFVEELEHEGEKKNDLYAIHNKLVDGYKRSQFHQRIQKMMQPILNEYEEKKRTGRVVTGKKIDYATSFLHQTGVVSVRTLKSKFRNPFGTLAQVMIMVVFAVILGAVYWQIDNDCTSGLQNRIGAFFFIIMNLIFSNISAIELFLKERAIFIHETVSGFYRVSAYFFAFIVCDVVPNRLLPATVFAVLSYFMLGLQNDAEKFFFYLLTLFLVSLTASGIAYFLSSAFNVFALANLGMALIFVIMMVFGGLLVNTDSIEDWLAWLKWISIFKYGLSALTINELKDFNFYNASGSLCSTNGNDYFVSQGINYETAWDKWLNIMALCIMATFFLSLTYVMLRRLKRLK